MLKLLVPVGHSPRSLQAVRHATFLYRERCASEVVLINVQAPLESTRLEAWHPLSRLRAIEEKFASGDLAMAERILKEAGVQYTVVMKVGPVADTIAAVATEPAATKSWWSRRGMIRCIRSWRCSGAA